MTVRLTYPTAVVMEALADGFRYGFDIMEATGLPSGTVYPILRRLENSLLTRTDWEEEQAAREQGRPPRKYYTLNGEGMRLLAQARTRFPGLSRLLEGNAGSAGSKAEG